MCRHAQDGVSRNAAATAHTVCVREVRRRVIETPLRGPPAARTTTPAGGADAFERLQRSAGNGAVARLVDTAPPGGAGIAAASLGLNRGVPASQTALLVQRNPQKGRSPAVKPPAPRDLADKGEEAEFTKLAVDLWRTRRNDLTLVPFAGLVLDEAFRLLRQDGVPVPKPNFGPTANAGPGVAAYFDPHDWSITVDVFAGVSEKATRLGPSAKLADLTPKEAATLAGSCYHEARHTQQEFQAARLVAEDAHGTKTAAALAAELGIPEVAAAAALAAMPMSAVERKEGAEWHALSQGGRHADYQRWNEKLRYFTAELAAMSFWQDYSSKGTEAVYPIWEKVIHPTVEKRYRAEGLVVAARKLDQLWDLPHRDSVDLGVLYQLSNIRDGIQDVLDAEAKLGQTLVKNRANAVIRANTPVSDPQEINIRKLEVAAEEMSPGRDVLALLIALMQLKMISEDAYRAYPEEADAYKRGGEVASEIEKGETAPVPAATVKRP